MSGNIRAQQNFAERLANVLRRAEHEGYGDKAHFAGRIGEEARDLTRWSQGTKMPAHALEALLGELPRHLADELIKTSGLRLVSREQADNANALRAAASASGFSSDVAHRMADGEWCHRDAEAAREHAQRVISDLQAVAGE